MNRGQNELRKGASGGGLRACKGPEVDCVRASLRRIEGPRWLELSEPRAEMGLGMAVLTRRHILYGVDTMSPHPHPSLQICLACCSDSAPFRPVLCVLNGGSRSPEAACFLGRTGIWVKSASLNLCWIHFQGSAQGLRPTRRRQAPECLWDRAQPRRPGLALRVRGPWVAVEQGRDPLGLS